MVPEFSRLGIEGFRVWDSRALESRSMLILRPGCSSVLSPPELCWCAARSQQTTRQPILSMEFMGCVEHALPARLDAC